MNLDERIKIHLEASTSHIQATSRLETIMAEGRNRRVRARMSTMLGTAAVVVAVVAVGSALLPGIGSDGPTATNPAVSDTTQPTAPPDTALSVSPADPGEARGVLVTSASGLQAIAADGTIELEVDSSVLGGEVGIAFPDTLGGLVYQHLETPDTWPDRSLMYLALGSDQPEVLVSPAEGESSLTPVGPALAPDGSPAFVYLAETHSGTESGLTLMRHTFSTGKTEPLLELDGSPEVTAGGNVASLMDRSDRGCARLALVDLSTGEEIPVPVDDCLPIDTGVAVSSDGTSLAMLSGGQLDIVEIPSGSEVTSRPAPNAFMITAGPGGWVLRSPDDTILLDGSGESELPGFEEAWVVPYAEPLDPRFGGLVGPLASTTTRPEGGAEETSCRRGDASLDSQDLPSAVASTRQAVYSLAATCDYDALADLALEHGTHLTFGEGATDPAALWLAEAESSIEPLTVLASLLNTSPAFEDEAGIWVWPAVHLEPGDEEAWAELEDELGREIVETLRPGGDGYYGYRIGIASDGTWQYFVAGD